MVSRPDSGVDMTGVHAFMQPGSNLVSAQWAAGFRALDARKGRLCPFFRGDRMTSSRVVGAVIYFQPLQILTGKGE